MTPDDERAPDRWWDSGMATPVDHMLSLPRTPRMVLYESAFVGLFEGLAGDRAVHGARIGFALWTAMRWARASRSPLEVVLGQVLDRARVAAAVERQERDEREAIEREAIERGLVAIEVSAEALPPTAEAIAARKAGRS